MNSQLRNTDDVIVYTEKFHFKCISWSAVLTGALIGIGISFIFNLFALAIGLTAFANTTAGPKSLAIGGMIGLVIIAIFSMGTGGWVAGYLGRPKSLHRDMGVIYGFTAWCVALLLTVLLSGHFGKFISYNLSALQNPSYNISNVYQRDRAMNPNAISDVTNTNATNIQIAQGQGVVNTQDAAKALAKSSFLSFVIFFIGALASCIGGHWGSRSCEKDILFYYKNKEIL